ncbi:O-antigen ligase family protein [Clostridium bowmanii]|uniref:O-antigen ligase family protein n=1 Tax=Clostridium bowmanii TaxID=132925 RepID=UPI001CD26CCF|nr:O-antigen ligase family protein [Clostridium bowmanii]
MFKGVTVTDFILALIIFLYVINLLVSKSGRGSFKEGIIDFFTDKLSIFIAVLLGIMLLSTLYATDKGLALSESARFITYIFLYFIIKYEFNNKKHINTLLKCYIFISTVLCCIGIVQYFTGFALNKTFIRTYNAGVIRRITSTFSNPNAFGAYLILIIFPVIMLSIYEKNKNKKILYILLSMLMFVNVVMTFSRNAILGLGLGLLVLTLIYSIKWIFALGGFAILISFIPSVSQRIKGTVDLHQNELRIKLWKTALYMIRDHPIVGVGNGNFVTRYNEYVSKYSELKYYEYKSYPNHNSYLKLQSELGILGIVSFLGIITMTLFRIKKLYSTTRDKFYIPFYTGVMASFIVFFFMNLSDNLFFVPKVTTYFWLILATAEAIRYKSHKSHEQ